jgi:hypothetical protein
MIIGASRRTDVPAFHSEWFMNRLRAGHVLVRNPVCKNVVYRINLDPKKVDCIVFITKDPGPMIRHLDEIDDMGFRYIFQVTVTPYGKDIEPGVRNKDEIKRSFIELSDRIGRRNIIWRYDPVIFGDGMDIGYHTKKFEELCSGFEGHTERCVFSFLDMYEKFRELPDGSCLRGVADTEKVQFAAMAGRTAESHGIELTSCCNSADLSEYGIRRRGCIDGETFRGLGIPYERCYAPLREGCLCVKNIDVGAYGTCRHNCVYCYANPGGGSRGDRSYDVNSEMLTGHLEKDDNVVSLKGPSNSRLTDFL